MEEQLIKKNCSTGEYSDIYPVTTLESVIDSLTGKNLREILDQYNHIYLPFKNNSKSCTRKQVPMQLRRKGLWITYISCKGNVITEYYNSTDYSNRAWENSCNWVKYLDDSIVQEMVNKVISWYRV